GAPRRPSEGRSDPAGFHERERAQRESDQGERRHRRNDHELDSADAPPHGRLRFHQRAPRGSAGARRRRPRTPSGTIVATVSFDGTDASSYERRTPQFAASFGTLSSKTSRSPVANVAAEVEIETDCSVGLAIEPSVVVTDPSVTVFAAIGVKPI